MSKRLLSAAGFVVLAAGIASGQTKDPNPGHDPSVFVGGPKYKKDKQATSRSLKGTVVDDTSRPLEGALVTLTDGKTKQKTTFITKKDGRYNFDDLSFTIDYQLVARYKNLQSEPRKLSQYDRSVNVVRVLEVTEPAQSEAAHSDPPPAK
jgi:Carboxypeptidase regulatory-like domain